MNSEQIKVINDAMSFLAMSCTDLEQCPSSQDFTVYYQSLIASMKKVGIDASIYEHFNTICTNIKIAYYYR
jgi:transposase